jgi:hypothetical protein
MLTRGAVKAAAGAGAEAKAKERARAKALGLLRPSCRQSNLMWLTALLRMHAAELEGALDTQDLEDEWQNTALTHLPGTTSLQASRCC